MGLGDMMYRDWIRRSDAAKREQAKSKAINDPIARERKARERAARKLERASWPRRTFRQWVIACLRRIAIAVATLAAVAGCCALLALLESLHVSDLHF